MDAIQEKIAAWLPRELVEQLVSQQQKPAAATSQPWVLELNLVELAAAGHAELVHEVLANPRAVCLSLWAYLASIDAFPRGTRVWMRIRLPWESNMPLSHSLQLACAAPSSLRSFSGVVAGISAEEEFIVDMTHGCGVCGSEQRVFLPDSSSAPTCCGVPMHHDLQQLVLCQARFILLAPATSSSTVAVPVLVRLRDDLAGSCKPGDFVTCTGIAECITGKCSQGRPAFAAVRVEALHVLHHPTALANFRRREESLSVTNPLTSLLGFLNDWLHLPCSSLTLTALLLSSACSTGTASPPSTALSASDEKFADAECDTINLSKSRDASCGNHRINILLLTAGHDSLETSLSPLAQALCSHVTHGSIPGSNLLPSALETLFGISSLVAVGQLGQASSGVCLLSQPLGAKHGRAVGEALQAGHATVALPSGQTCTVELNPTIWCLSAAPDLLPKQTAGQKFNKFASTGKNACKNEAPLAVLFAEKSSPQLAAQFDVILDCDSIEDESAEAWADDYLAALVAGEPPAEEEERAARRENARLALQDHISTCQQLAQPTMTPSAMGFLKSYWTATRSTASGNGCGVSAAFLHTAAKLAAASARLFHRTEVLTFPDATLAVALCEEGLIARGWDSELSGPWREQMVYGRDLVDCLSDFHKHIVQVSKHHGWEWDAREE